jgi:hypothetical protein
MKRPIRKSKKEIILSKEEGIAKAKRYLANAKETIRKSPVEYGLYTDSKYVREGSGIGYLAALVAMDAYLISKGWRNDELPKSIDDYWVAKRSIPHNGKFTAHLTRVYQNLHRAGYYDGVQDTETIKSGLHSVDEIIKMLEK